eukprot:3878026-Prymnesium_polylepis.1
MAPRSRCQAPAIIAHPAVRAVALTGSCGAGRAVAAKAGKHLKRCLLELGGSDPCVPLVVGTHHPASHSRSPTESPTAAPPRRSTPPQ